MLARAGLLLSIASTTAFALVTLERSPGCKKHGTQSACLMFRRQHDCVWDVPSSTCIPDTPCDARTRASCEFELTTGAPWDGTRNRCFFDAKKEACRWTDECLGHGSKAECRQAGCSWQKRCTPADMRFYPGPNVCARVCALPGEGDDGGNDAAAAGNVTVPAAPAAVPVSSDATLSTTEVVTMPAGKVQGVRYETVDAFLGMPYAASPVGELRWAPPEALPKWQGTFSATSYTAGCAQSTDYSLFDTERCVGYTRGVCAGTSEDCLGINVYAPRNARRAAAASAAAGASPEKKDLKAVMVWIHGGCFVSGSASSSSYNGTHLAAAEDVVVVTIGYRLAVFGWLGHDGLRSRDKEQASTGNYGLQDNVLALKWIQTNIASLGGDPDRVTIFGESSGAGSVSQLLGVEPAWPYFHHAIMESGAGSFWTYMNMATAYSLFDAVAAKTGCSSGDIEAQVSCLANAPAGSLRSTTVTCRDGCAWSPVVDGVLVRGRTTHLARTGKLRPNTPVMIGHNLNDGAMFVGQSYTSDEKVRNAYFTKRFGPQNVAAMEKAYPTRGAQTEKTRLSPEFMSMQDCETDWSYACTNQFLGDAAPGPAYLYKFSQTASNGLALHGDEIKYVFGNGNFDKGSDNEKVSSLMMKYWANFARSGDPNSEAEDDLPTWPEWTSDRALLNITASPEPAKNVDAAGCIFFDENWSYFKICMPQNPSGLKTRTEL